MTDGFHISPYACTFAGALVAGFLTVFILLRKGGVPWRYIGYSMFLNVILILYGSRMYSMVAGGFRTSLWNAGISSLGGVIGLLAGVIIFGCIYDEGKALMWESYILAMPLMYGIAKIGCYLVGCCHGIKYSGPLAVTYDSEYMQGGPYFPVQLLESIVFIIVFMIGLGVYRSHRRKYTGAVVMLLCAMAKFAQEFLREEHVGKSISGSQWICIGFFLWSLILFTEANKRIQVELHEKEIKDSYN